MKSFILSLAFMLVATFSFANNSNVNNLNDLDFDRRIIYETSCGETVILHFTDDYVTFGQVFDAIHDAEDWLC